MLTADELAAAFGSDDPYAIREHIDALTEALAAERVLADELAAELTRMEWHDGITTTLSGGNIVDHYCPACGRHEIPGQHYDGCEPGAALGHYRAARTP